MTDIKNVCEYLLSGDNYLIIMHDSPDGDTVGSGYALCRALRQIGKSADCVCGDKIPDKYDYMTDGVKSMCKQYDHVLTVDVADIRLIREYGKRYEGKIELSIDHHDTNIRYAHHTYVRGDASAACEIIYDVVLGLGCEMTQDIARCLFTGISTDTGCFKYANVTSGTHLRAAKLLEAGVNASEINRLLFETKERTQLRAEGIAAGKLRLFANGKISSIAIEYSDYREGVSIGDFETAVDIARSVRGTVCAAVIKASPAKENTYRVSMRSNGLNVAEVAAAFGGGGHVRAAGCTLYCASAKEAERIIVAALEAAL